MGRPFTVPRPAPTSVDQTPPAAQPAPHGLELGLVAQSRPVDDSVAALRQKYDEIKKETDQLLLHQVRSGQQMLNPLRHHHLAANADREQIERALRFETSRLKTMAEQSDYYSHGYYSLRYDIDDALNSDFVFAHRMTETDQEPN